MRTKIGSVLDWLIALSFVLPAKLNLPGGASQAQVVIIDTVPDEAPPGNCLRRWRVFPGDGRQLGVLRRWLEYVLPGCEARDDLTSVATELASNAIRHTRSGRGGCFAVEIALRQHSVRVAVTDNGAPDGPRLVDDPDAESGRGLLLVRALAVRTGVRGDQRSRMVWAELPWPADQRPADQRPMDQRPADQRPAQSSPDAIVVTPNRTAAFVVDHLSVAVYRCSEGDSRGAAAAR